MSLSLIEYDYKVEQYMQPSSITTNCIDLQFINAGTVAANIDGLILLPGQSVAIGGNLGEVCRAQRNLSFANTPGTRLVYFVKRFYVTN
jgi:hypothetical protein